MSGGDTGQNTKAAYPTKDAEKEVKRKLRREQMAAIGQKQIDVMKQLSMVGSRE
jgi:hypothetical protein